MTKISSRNLYVIQAIITLGFTIFLAACENDSRDHSFAFETMGTEASCQLELPPSMTSDNAEAKVRETYSRINIALNTWSPDSEISHLNRAPADSNVTTSSLLHTCLLVSKKLQDDSNGAFDPTAESLMRLWGFYQRQGKLPSQAALDTALADLGRWHLIKNTQVIVKEKAGTQFDLGGIAKGMALDIAAKQLREAGVQNGLIDLGGNLFCLGGAPGRQNWRVGIRNPLNRDELFATVTISNESVATSGSYERFVMIDGRRFGHIMNPATGRPAEGILSATAIAPEGILADGLSTTLFVLGPDKALPFLKKHYPQVEAILVFPGPTADQNIISLTPGLKNRFFLMAGFENQYRVVYED